MKPISQARKSVLLIDRFMTHFIKVGGIGIIVAVFAIFLFIFFQILPLFRGAEVREAGSVPFGRVKAAALGSDEWGETPFVLTEEGHFLFARLADKRIEKIIPDFGAQAEFTAFAYDSGHGEAALATADGRLGIARVSYEPDFESGTRVVRYSVEAEPFFDLGRGTAIRRIAYSGGNDRMAVAIRAGEKPSVTAAVISGETLTHASDLAPQIGGDAELAAVHSKSGVVLVADSKGTVTYFEWTGDGFVRRQMFNPFPDSGDGRIASMDFLLGGNTAVFTNAAGVNRLFSLYIKEGADSRQFGLIRELRGLEGPAAFFDASLRNKAFLTGHASRISLRYATTGNIRWEIEPSYRPERAILNGKYSRIFVLSDDGRMHAYVLSDPHPDAGWRAFFGKIWYESAPKPSYEWQSSSGSDEFEPKHSLVPLIFGTLKGTFYALVFALPVALLAAVYTSQFLHPNLKSVVKPLMEIMASLPSVVLGFLAALWLAPLIEDKVPSLTLAVLAAPPAALFCGYVWARLPSAWRGRFKPGYEFLILLPFIVLACGSAWSLGPVLERIAFGGDFRLWWVEATGTAFEQRNSLVVGFIMGFAVIPIIFTVSEDALSNVPTSLTSASLALGASRWQTALRIVIPTASAGMLSAIMIGVGRAVGETMIVVMATGNTPIMDVNIFSGMRTLAANIAVELPEAPVHSTLYRTLFLGAMALFLMTFFVNTLAEVLRQRLREKYKLI